STGYKGTIRADPRVIAAWVQKYFWRPQVGVVILPTPPLYKCFYGNDSNKKCSPKNSSELLLENPLERAPKHSTGDGQRLQSQYRRWSDCRHNTEDGQRLQTWYRRWSETADMEQEMVRDCRHDTRDDQRLQAYYRRWSETGDIIQAMVRDCRHSTGDGQRLEI
ncbi:hypothetical protein AB205_0150690, partial [Aquarana catesbeiana]